MSHADQSTENGHAGASPEQQISSRSVSPGRQRWHDLAAGGLAVVSGAVTAIYRGPADNGVALWWLAELVVSLGLLYWLVRRGAGTGGLLFAVAIALSSLRITLQVVPPSSSRGALLGCLMCAGLAAAVGGAGRYLHLLDRRRVRAVHEARQAQRLGLARDLHDFVAHDVSGIVAQAQAGQVSKDPAIAQEALRRIEAAGLRALASMDRTVHLLSPGPARYGLADLPDLVEQYASDVTLELPPLEPPREVGAAAYRIVAEALTNIRRHAPATTRITVAVGQAADRLTTVVTNHTTNATPVRSSRRGGGLGLVRLTELVEALGGELEAGPVPGGWQVSATLPLGAAS